MSLTMASANTNYKRPWSDDGVQTRSPQVDSAGSSQYPVGEQFGTEHSGSKPEDTAPEQPINFKHLRGPRDRISESRDPFGTDFARYLSAQRSPPRIGKRADMESPWYTKTLEETPPNKMMKYTTENEPTRLREYSKPTSNYDGAYNEQGRRPASQLRAGPVLFDPPPTSAHKSQDLTGSMDVGRYGASPKSCDVCGRASCIAPQIARGLQRLLEQLKFLSARSKGDSIERTPELEASSQPVPESLIDSLDYSLEKLHENLKVAKEMLFTLSLEDNEGRRRSPGDSGPDRPVKARWEEDRFLPRTSHSSTPTGDENKRSHEFSQYYHRDDRAATKESSFPQGPYGSNSSQMRRPTSPRPFPALPSPNSIKFSTTSSILPPVSSNVMGGGGHSPHTAHLQDLQHQLSTKSLAHQILQGEHEKLLAAYSRSQTRCAALDKKSQVSDSEISNLTEDRLRLQSQIDALDLQLEELQASRDEAHKQSVASGAQYMQIMQMSSRLQAQSASDLKKWKSDRDAWAQEKDELLAKVLALEKTGGVARVLKQDLGKAGQSADEQNAADEVELSTMSFDRLKEEILSLRRSKREAEVVIQAFRDEGDSISRLIEELSGTKERWLKLANGTSPQLPSATEHE